MKRILSLNNRTPKWFFGRRTRYVYIERGKGMECINLQDEFGDRYKVTYDESYYAQYGKNARTVDPWLMIVLCEHGHIYPHGDELLGISTDRCGGVSKRLASLPFVTVVQDGDDGINAVFHVDHFDAVAEIIKPRKRRRHSPERRRQLAEQLGAYQFTPRRPASQARKWDLERPKGSPAEVRVGQTEKQGFGALD